MKDKISAFDQAAHEYDEWFDTHKFAYESELNAIRPFIPEHGLGLEIGAGTGRFSVPFSISIGIEPSEVMAGIASSRGITVHHEKAENLPFCEDHFDFVLMTTTLCFLDDPVIVLQKIHKTLKPKGTLIIGFIDKDSSLGKKYESFKENDPIYRFARFYSTKDVIELLESNEFEILDIYQTIFQDPDKLDKVEPFTEGYGNGSFVVINSKTTKEGIIN